MVKAFSFAITAAALFAVLADANPNQPLDRPYTLRNLEPFLVEAEHHRIIGSDKPWSDILPRPCVSVLDSSQACPEAGRLRYRNDAAGRSLVFMPLAGYEYRYLDENASTVDFGVVTSGQSGPVSFYLDARMFSEFHEKADHASFDREPLDRQDEQTSGSLAYSSFARYRTNLNYDWSWGRLSAGRDAAQWGPGLFSNLVFHQDAVPFNQLSFTTHLGPLTVQSLYGELIIGEDWETNTSTDSRHLYAHRYELRALPNLLLGVSEQLILYDKSAPFAFLPVVPLFIAKYSEKERLNNGNLAADVSYRFPGWATLYSEFLIDDLQSPGSFFDDNWGNKWGWMAGGHVIRDAGARQTGAILEYARIEPWVYTHYRPNSAQTANFDRPLGNQDGPNSQSITAKAYLRQGRNIYASLMGRWVWKGVDSGSSVLDIHTEGRKEKVFLGPGTRLRFRISPMLSYRIGSADLLIQADWGTDPRFLAGVRAAY
jgi:hypothetical protein